MKFQILDFVFPTLVSLGSGFANETVFLQQCQNGMKIATIEQESLKQDITSNLLERSSNILNYIEFDDLESIMTTEFVQGLPSDTEFAVW